MQIRRKWRWLLAGALLGAVLLVALALLPQRHPIDKATVDRIRPGMTRGEVEELLGGRGLATARTPVPGQTKTAWMGSEGGCVVVFDADGRVVGTSYGVMKRSSVERALIRVRMRAEEWAGEWD